MSALDHWVPSPAPNQGFCMVSSISWPFCLLHALSNNNRDFQMASQSIRLLCLPRVYEGATLSWIQMILPLLVRDNIILTWFFSNFWRVRNLCTMIKMELIRCFDFARWCLTSPNGFSCQLDTAQYYLRTKLPRRTYGHGSGTFYYQLM